MPGETTIETAASRDARNNSKAVVAAVGQGTLAVTTRSKPPGRRRNRRPVFDESRQMDLRPIPLNGDWVKLQRQLAELPILAISADRGVFRWENAPDAHGKWGLDPSILWIETTPSGKGAATVDDGDLLVYLQSKIMEGAARRIGAGYEVLFSGAEFLAATGGSAGGGAAYEQIERRLDRLQGTQIKTCARAGKYTCRQSFTLIGPWKSVTPRGRNAHFAVTLALWTAEALAHGEVLSLGAPGAYFRLRPLKKRLFLLLRKHIGAKKRWHITLSSLYEKVGVDCTRKKFVEQLKRIIAENDLPRFKLQCDFCARWEDRVVTVIARDPAPKTPTRPRSAILENRGPILES